MTIRSWLISRRTCLRGLGGIALSLPLFETMGWANPPKGSSARPPVRLGFMYHPYGVWQTDFWPTDPKTYGTTLPKNLEVIRPILDQCLLLDRLRGAREVLRSDGRPPHTIESSAWLTAALYNLDNRTNIDLAVSADQIAAQQIGAYTPLPSLELGCFDNSAVGLGESGVSRRYYNVHSFRTPNEPLPLEISPGNVLKRMFSSRQSTPRRRAGPAPANGQFAVAPEISEGESLDRSMLDLVGESAKDLRMRVSMQDQRSLDQYLNTLRSLEVRVAAIEKQQAEAAIYAAENAGSKGRNRNSPPIEVAIPSGKIKWSDHVRVMADLMILAFQTDTTRVCSLMPTVHRSDYTELGITNTHHDLSHTEGNADKIKKLSQIDRINLEQFTYLISRMHSLKEGAGTLLDNCIIMWGSGMDGPVGNQATGHGQHRIPTIIAGRGGGTIRTGRYLPQCTGNIGDLLTGMLMRAGVKLDKPLGCGTKPTADLS